jgi:hypothetical protein
MDVYEEIKKTIEQASGIDSLKPLSSALETTVDQLGETAMVIGKQAMSPTFKTAFAYAHPFMMAMGDVIMGWMLLWRAAVSAPKLEKLVGHLEGEKKPRSLKRTRMPPSTTARFRVPAISSMRSCRSRLDAWLPFAPATMPYWKSRKRASGFWRALDRITGNRAISTFLD